MTQVIDQGLFQGGERLASRSLRKLGALGLISIATRFVGGCAAPSPEVDELRTSATRLASGPMTSLPVLEPWAEGDPTEERIRVTGFARPGPPLPHDESRARPRPHVRPTFPSIRAAARRAGDPKGKLPIGEVALWNGSYAQAGTTRWGDYASMSVDPSDDCTVWSTHQYVESDAPTSAGRGRWATRIFAFSPAGCPSKSPSLSVPGISFTGSFPSDSNGDVSRH